MKKLSIVSHPKPETNNVGLSLLLLFWEIINSPPTGPNYFSTNKCSRRSLSNGIPDSGLTKMRKSSWPRERQKLFDAFLHSNKGTRKLIKS